VKNAIVKNKKTSVVFVNKFKKFFTVNNFSDFENLVSIMSDSAFNKADKKIQLKEKIISNNHKQLCLFPEAIGIGTPIAERPSHTNGIQLSKK